jgi:group I intron endonuclease
MSTIKPGIYKITNTENGKIYIGSAYNLSNRMATHKYSLRNKKHKNPHLQLAWNKYGEDKFTFEVLEIVQDKSLVLEREQYYIDLLNPCDKNIGYNIAKKAGNTAGIKASDETRKKQSESAKKRKKRKLTDKQREKLINRYKGQIKPWAKLNWEIVNEIRNMYLSGIFQKNIAKKFSLAQTTVSEIIRNDIWEDKNYTYKRRRNG